VQQSMFGADSDPLGLGPVALARRVHRAHLQLVGDGHICPVCNVHQQVRRRPLSRQMAAFLRALVRHEERHGRSWYTARDFLPAGHKASSDGTYLAAWDFIVPGEARGTWRSTVNGQAWALGHASAPPAVFTVEPQGGVLGLDHESAPVTIRQCWPMDWDSGTHPPRSDP